MTGELVLITGATGHVGFRTLRYALEHGYRVRAAVRSESKAEIVRSSPALKAQGYQEGQLSFVIVPDITAKNAYDTAIKDVKYVIHVASPLSHNAVDGNYQRDLVNPAINGTLNMLQAAASAGTVRRIVITSSVIAITPLESFAEHKGTGRINADNRIPEHAGSISSPFEGYATAKVAALNRAEAWVAENKPSFDLIHIMPSYVEGRNDMTTTLADFDHGSNRFIITTALGQKAPAPAARCSHHVDDVALVHVRALEPQIKGNQSFLVDRDDFEWNDVKKVIEKRFPDAVRKGIFSLDGDTPSKELRFDAQKTVDTFGIKLKGFEEQVVSVLDHYLEVYRKEKGGK